MSDTKVFIDKPYADVKAALLTHTSVDMVTVGLPPASFRWLNSKNTYINVGLEVTEKGVALTRDGNNSYLVPQSDLLEIEKSLLQHMANPPKEAPDRYKIETARVAAEKDKVLMVTVDEVIPLESDLLKIKITPITISTPEATT